MELLFSIGVGIGLSAACGFRIFVPLLVMSIAAHAGHLTLVPTFQWIGSDAAFVTFAVATCLEIAAYYIPWLDHALDVYGVTHHALVRRDLTGELDAGTTERAAAAKPALPRQEKSNQLPHRVKTETTGHDRVACEMALEKP